MGESPKITGAVLAVLGSLVAISGLVISNAVSADTAVVVPANFKFGVMLLIFGLLCMLVSIILLILQYFSR